MKKIYLLLLLLTLGTAAFAQTGTLKGTVTDKETGEAIVGAAVYITGTSKAASTDIDGKYSLQLAPGIYNITVSLISYKQTTNSNIKIEAGKTTILDLAIEESAHALETVSIIGTRQTNSDISMLNDIRQSEIVVSGISGQQIARSMDRDAAQVVKRIPGVTITNNRFIMVRGLSERYNTVLLNDALTPSSEVDARAFSFDVLPSRVIDRIMIFKSASPELPGDFAGGAIKIYTKNFNEENTTESSFSTSYRTGTTFSDFGRYKGGKTDFLGFDDGTRTLPGSFPTRLTSSNLSQNAELGRQLPNTWTPTYSQASPDMRFTLGMARKMHLGEVRISNLTSLMYSNTRQFTDIERNTYNVMLPGQDRAGLETNIRDRQSTENVRMGVLHSWSASLNERNKIEFRNLFNQLGINQVTERAALDYGTSTERRDYGLRYESRTIYSGQLHGTHQSASENTTYNWSTGYAYTNRNEPDYRRARTTRELGSDNEFQVVVPPGPTTLDAARFFSNLKENTLMASGNMERKFAKRDTLAENQKKLRAGFYTERKSRDFAARWMSYVRAPNHNYALDQLPLDQIFAPENINTNGGFVLAEGTNPSDRYEATNTLAAGYVAGTLPLNKVTLSGGVRVEHNIRQLTTGSFGGAEIEVNNPVTSVLPSLNVTYNFNKRSLVRAGYGITVNRPEFREQAPFTYYDFNYNFEVKGNQELKTATIQNAELRYEFYPNPTELISVGAFYKHFTNPIEMYVISSSSNNTYTFVNAGSARSIGLETELRKSLLGLTGSKLVDNMQLVLNASVINSRVDFGNNLEGQDPNRPMQGQSPYIINTGLYYNNTDRGWQISAMYNVIGRRIFLVGNYAEPTVYEMPRHVVDLTVSKTLGRLEIKAGVQDIFNQATRLIQDSNEDGKITRNDGTYTRFRTGVYSTAGITYRF